MSSSPPAVVEFAATSGAQKSVNVRINQGKILFCFFFREKAWLIFSMYSLLVAVPMHLWLMAEISFAYFNLHPYA